MAMIYVTSDWHGYPLQKMQALLKKVGFGDDDELYVLGDVIDRNGDGGVKSLLWMMDKPNVTLLLGNHEAMLLSCKFLFQEITEESVQGVQAEQLRTLSGWLLNGGQPTLESLKRLHREEPDQLYDLLDYLTQAPLYEGISAGGQDYILCHAGLGNFAPDKRISAYQAHDLLWNRPRLEDRYLDGVTVVFGHTPTQFFPGARLGRMLQTETWIDVDTGAAGGGAPMLLRLDDLKAFYAR